MFQYKRIIIENIFKDGSYFLLECILGVSSFKYLFEGERLIHEKGSNSISYLKNYSQSLEPIQYGLLQD
jgi:hypothetical protein